MTRFLSAVGCVCVAAAVAAAPGEDTKPTAADAERLVQQLGSARHAEREAAARALDALGPAALPALREAAKSGDAEVSRRAGELLAKLDRQAESAAALAPTKVHLKVTDTPLADVVREFTKQSKLKVQLVREPVDLPGRKVTLDTGSVGPWQALAGVCRAAKVSIQPEPVDPAGAEPSFGVVGVPAAPAAPALPVAGGGAIAFTVAPRGLADEPLVLQDGTPPEYPTAILGAVRVRLIPDQWANRDRKPGEERKWTLEILTEPKVTWVGRPSFRFNSVPGLRADATPGGDDSSRRISRVSTTTSIVRLSGETVRGPSRHELPVYVKGDESGSGPVDLTGVLAGTVQAPAGTMVSIADVTQPKATATTKDRLRMTVLESERADDGTVTLRLEIERPGGSGASTTSTRSVKRAGTNGAIPVTAVRAMTGVSGAAEAFRLTDDKGRPYEVTVTRSEVAPRSGMAIGTFTLECEPPPGASGPKVLELTGPRSVAVEAAFTLRDVPRP